MCFRLFGRKTVPTDWLECAYFENQIRFYKKMKRMLCLSFWEQALQIILEENLIIEIFPKLPLILSIYSMGCLATYLPAHWLVSSWEIAESAVFPIVMSAAWLVDPQLRGILLANMSPVIVLCFFAVLTLMLLVANFAQTKWCKKVEKWRKHWQMGTHLGVLNESFPMNTIVTGF